MTPLNWVKLFAAFVGITDRMVDLFTEEHPELIAPPHPDTPPEAPVDDVDPAVRDAIERGDV